VKVWVLEDTSCKYQAYKEWKCYTMQTTRGYLSEHLIKLSLEQVRLPPFQKHEGHLCTQRVPVQKWNNIFELTHE